jgi:hypothetical protein
MNKVEAFDSEASLSLPIRLALDGITHRLQDILTRATGLAQEVFPEGHNAAVWKAQRRECALLLIRAIETEVEAGWHQMNQWAALLSSLNPRKSNPEGNIYLRYQPAGEPMPDFLQRATYLARNLRRSVMEEENADALSLASSKLSQLGVNEQQSDRSFMESNPMDEGGLNSPRPFMATSSWLELPPPKLRPVPPRISRTPSPTPPPPVQLPKVRLLEFSGDPAEWPQFWQVFDFAVHSNPDLPDHIKLSYLLGQLVKGSAPHCAVSGYDCTGENYPLVVEALQQRFGDPRRRIDRLLDQLMELPPVRDTASALRDFVDILDNNCRQLEGRGSLLDDPALLRVLKSKLPASVLSELCKTERRTGIVWDLAYWRRELCEFVTEREEVERVTHHSRTQPKSESQPPMLAHSSATQIHCDSRQELEILPSPDLSPSSPIPPIIWE